MLRCSFPAPLTLPCPNSHYQSPPISPPSEPKAFPANISPCCLDPLFRPFSEDRKPRGFGGSMWSEQQGGTKNRNNQRTFTCPMDPYGPNHLPVWGPGGGGNRRQEVVNNVRTQFRERPGIMDGSQKPDYASCVGSAGGSDPGSGSWNL